MPWQEREQIILVKTELEGLLYLYGDTLAQQYGQERLEGKTYPVITFPSNVIRELSYPHGNDPYVHLFGSVHVPLTAPPKRITAQILQTAYFDQLPITVADITERSLMVINHDTRRGYKLFFQDNRISDIQPYPERAMELLPGELRAVLPPIRTTDGKGWEAVAPVKFFTPDSNWTWYPSEFDGADLFFGLVIGFEAELGYFSLAELEGLHGPLNLPLERDRYFKPMTLQRLYDNHNYQL